MIKLLEDNIREMIGTVDFRYNTKRIILERKYDDLDLIKVKYFFLYKGHCYENKKRNHRFGENICRTHI